MSRRATRLATMDPNAPPLKPAQKVEEIKIALQDLHADEMPDLAKKPGQITTEDEQYSSLFKKNILNYLRYLRATWSRAFWSTMFLPTNIFDRLSIYAFAFFSSVILGFLLIWCLIFNFPYVKTRYEAWSKKNAHGLSMTNASYPYLFQELVGDEMKAAREALAEQIAPHPTTLRVFNLDIAKLLLQCSAIMYERSSDPLHKALEATRAAALHPKHRQLSNPPVANPGDLLNATLGEAAAQEVRDELHAEEDHMSKFAADIGFEYSTISELNSQSSAFCGIFYDPTSNYMILSFRGTSPTEWSEWAADFTYEPRHAGHTIRGFGKVHGGFFDRIFPRKISRGARLPYDTIKEGIKATAAILQQGEQNKEINVWFTGHSLGTALASLVYATAISEPNAFGPNVVLRDAYLFATPIVSDVQSVHSFHNRLNRDKVRTMWRITNGEDIVATGLPHSGDHQSWSMSPYNLFSFAHLGMEIKLRDFPKRSAVTGNQFPHGSHVRIHSAMVPLKTKNGAPLTGTSNSYGYGLFSPSINGNGAYSPPFSNGAASPLPNGGGGGEASPLPTDGAASPNNAFDGALTPVSSSSPLVNGGGKGALKLNGTGSGTNNGSSPALSPFLKTEFGDRPRSRHIVLTSDDEECASPTYQDIELPQLPPLPPSNAKHPELPSPQVRQLLRERLRWWQNVPFVGRIVAHSTAAYWDQLQNVRVGGCEWLDE